MARARRVLFVGRRAAALGAAARLGVEVGLVAPDERRTDETLVFRLPGPAPADGADGWRVLAEALPEPERLDAVVGLVESAVVPAAQLRAALGLPGLDVATAERCTDKLRMKQALRAAGIPCTHFAPVEPDVRADALLDALGLPLVLKPRVGSGTRGQLRVCAPAELPEPLPAGYLAERFVAGAEMSCEALLADGRVLFENPTEYLVAGAAHVLPARLAGETAARVSARNRSALAALGVGVGMTHLELFLGEGGPIVSELAARPPGGHIMRLLEIAWGFDAWEAWLRIHLGETPVLPARARRAAAAWVLHPGAGRVRAVHGVEAARALPGVVALRVRVGPGDAIGPRSGVGQEVGHLLVEGRDRDEAAARLRAAYAAFAIELSSGAH